MKFDSYVGQVVMIIGVVSGFGVLFVCEFVVMGVWFVFGDLNGDVFECVVVLLCVGGVDVFVQCCDVCIEMDVVLLVQEVVVCFGWFDVGINNVGIVLLMKVLIDIDEVDFDLSFVVNVKGVFFGMKYQICQMFVQCEGVILNVVLMVGFGGVLKLVVYVVLKYVVVGFMKMVVFEYVCYGICVNVVCLFYSVMLMVIDSEIGECQEFLVQGLLMKWFGCLDEIVVMMLMLCVKENMYLIGQVVVVDGGVLVF